MIAVGLADRLHGQCLEHRRRGAVHDRRRSPEPGWRWRPGIWRGWWILPLMCVAGALAGAACAAIPAFLRTRAQRQRDPLEPDADLCGDPAALLSDERAVEGPGRASTSRRAACSTAARRCPTSAGSAISTCRIAALIALGGLVPDGQDHLRLPDPGGGRGAACGALRRVQPQPDDLAVADGRGAGWRGWPASSRRRGPSGRWCRSFRPATGSPRSSWRSSGGCIRIGIVILGGAGAGRDLRGRRDGADDAGTAERGDRASSRRCCCSSCWRRTSSSTTGCASARPDGSRVDEQRRLYLDLHDHRRRRDAAAAGGTWRAGGGEERRAEPRGRGDDADRRGHRLRGDVGDGLGAGRDRRGDGGGGLRRR